VLGCLAKTPAGRPQSAAALDRALASIEIEPWTQDDAAGWWANQRIAPVPLTT
jgi:hypothetical protein